MGKIGSEIFIPRLARLYCNTILVVYTLGGCRYGNLNCNLIKHLFCNCS